MVSDTGLISVSSFTRQKLGEFFSSVDQIPSVDTSKIGLLGFFEKSSRTRASFETAGLELGLRWVYFEPETSSLEKGESLRDHFELFKIYPINFLVIRHPQPGICSWIYEWTQKPVINAGEGAYEHPTQALGDALTLYEISSSKKWKICFYGDLVKSRVARSSLQVFKKMGWDVFACDDGAEDTRLFAKAFEVPLVTSRELFQFDVIYALRTQLERGAGQRLAALSVSDLGAQTKIMHPGPVIWGQDLQMELKFEMERSLILTQVESCYRVRRQILANLCKRESQ